MPYVYAVFLRLPCESILHPRQCFHLVDKRITVREFNTHVRPALTVRTYYSDDDISHHGHCTLSPVYVYKVKYILASRDFIN